MNAKIIKLFWKRNSSYNKNVSLYFVHCYCSQFLWFVMDISKNYMPDIVKSTKVAQTTQGLRAVGFWPGTLSTGRTGAGSLFKKSKSLTLWVLSSRQTELGWSRGGDLPSCNCFLLMSILLHLKACLPGWASNQALPSATPIISSSPLNLCTWQLTGYH